MRPLRNLALICTVLLGSLSVAGAASAQKWELLGEKEVGFRADRDVISVGRKEGRYEKLQLRVENNDIEILDLKVVYGNGDVQDIRVRSKIRAGSETRPLDLTGDRGRFIKQIEIAYKTDGRRRDGRAIVKVFGDPVRGGRDRGDRGGDRADRPKFDWESLGSRKVGFLIDRDVIKVGRREGKFHKLKIAVKGNDIEILDLKVVYANGKPDDIRVRQKLKSGSETRPLDLEGRGRRIDRIELVYKSRPSFRGQATLEVFGLQQE